MWSVGEKVYQKSICRIYNKKIMQLHVILNIPGKKKQKTSCLNLLVTKETDLSVQTWQTASFKLTTLSIISEHCCRTEHKCIFSLGVPSTYHSAHGILQLKLHLKTSYSPCLCSLLLTCYLTKRFYIYF